MCTKEQITSTLLIFIKVKRSEFGNSSIEMDLKSTLEDSLKAF
jgi:hypothetical protein